MDPPDGTHPHPPCAGSGLGGGDAVSLGPWAGLTGAETGAADLQGTGSREGQRTHLGRPGGR